MQGSVAEHVRAVKRAGCEAIEVNRPEQLEQIDGLILPGGESTTIGKLLHLFRIFEPLQDKLKSGLPCFGTCAGLILLAKEVVGEEPHLSVLDVTVRRNAYGRQIDSFAAKEIIPAFCDKPIEMVFIRAPWIEKAFGEAQVLKEYGGHIVAVRQNNLLATTFHPELTSDGAVHRYFADMARAWRDKA